LQLVLRAVRRYGAGYVRHFIGDFAFLVWHAAARYGVAACDAFRVKQLYYSEHKGVLAFGSRAEALALEDRYEEEYLAQLVAMCSLSPTLSVYAGVYPVPAGAMAVLDGARVTVHQYWSPDEFRPAAPSAGAEREEADACRELLAEAVRLRLDRNGATWAQLSGGLDSSSVVGVAQWLVERGKAPHGLGGTITYVDRQGTGADERAYSDSVIMRWRLPNETIVDPPLWYDGRYPLPLVDQPRPNLMFYPRDRRLCETIRARGGRVLLTGLGSDELLRGNMFFFADWLVQGRIGQALREMARRAAIGHVSLWALAYRNAILPLLPPVIQRHLSRNETALPRWVDSAMAQRYGLHERMFEVMSYAGDLGRKYHHAVALGVASLGRVADYGVVGEALDVRHPFLYRPLVEFGLQLPPDSCTRPHARKWVLRAAMREILPDVVRMRVGKGTPSERYAWSLANQRSLLEPLIHEPILADLRIVDTRELKAAFEIAPHQPGRRVGLHSALQGVLAIEAWLQMRAGRWPRGAA
jgi:asparagine synthase (glutamine-hydrolysing)